jgi:hypothetical protein
MLSIKHEQTYTITDDENILSNTIVRFGIRIDLNLNDTLPEEDLTICIENYIEHYEVIENILFYYKKDPTTVDNDQVTINSCDSNISHVHQKKNVNIRKTQHHDIIHDDNDKAVLDHNEKYNTAKKVLAGMGVDLITETKRVRKGKKFVNETYHTIQKNRNIYEIVYCLVNKSKYIYNDEFVSDLEQHFNKYKQYLVKCE